MILKLFLSKNKISAEDKRTLRNHRKENNISNEEHFAILSQMGWTEEEYDDGEKVLICCDKVNVIREMTILTWKGRRKSWKMKTGSRFSQLRRRRQTRAKRHCIHFQKFVPNSTRPCRKPKVCGKISKYQYCITANFTVSEVGVVVNTKTRNSYMKKKLSFVEKMGVSNVEEVWGFHGTSRLVSKY